MDSIVNKSFKNRLTGDVITIIDVYQNIAVTSSKERINVNVLSNDKLFIPLNSSINESNIKPIISHINDDVVDPNTFFNNQIVYDEFADKIKQFPLDKFNNMSEGEQSISPNVDRNYLPSSNESAVIYSDVNDEIEELKQKYGASSVDDNINKQNEALARIANRDFNENENVQHIRVEDSIIEKENYNNSNSIQKEDPVLSLFKNVKRNISFKTSFSFDGKIPRVDFIEMMEDSYEISIIDYLAEDFTNTFLSNREEIKKVFYDKIKEMLNSSKKVVAKKQAVSKVRKNANDSLKRDLKNKRSVKTPSKLDTKNSEVVIDNIEQGDNKSE